MKKQTELLDIVIIADSIGDTARKVIQAALAQFPNAESKVHRFNFISQESEITPALNTALETNAIIFITMVNEELVKIVESFSIEYGLTCYNLIQPFTLEIERRLGIKASSTIGAQYELSEEYFKRVKAMEFTINNDDGKDPNALKEAEIVILGISRTGKTPLSMFLGTQGYKVTNLPLIPEKEVTPILFDINPNKIIGLTNEPEIISQHRQKRMSEYGIDTQTQYATMKRVVDELEYAHSIYRKLACPIINVADRSVEESGSIILDLLELTH